MFSVWPCYRQHWSSNLSVLFPLRAKSGLIIELNTQHNTNTKFVKNTVHQSTKTWLETPPLAMGVATATTVHHLSPSLLMGCADRRHDRLPRNPHTPGPFWSWRHSMSVWLKDEGCAQLTACHRSTLRSRLTTASRILPRSTWSHLFATSSFLSLLHLCHLGPVCVHTCLCVAHFVGFVSTLFFPYSPVFAACHSSSCIGWLSNTLPTPPRPCTHPNKQNKPRKQKKIIKPWPTSDHTKHCQLDFPKAFDREIQIYLKLMESASALLVLPNCLQPHVNSHALITFQSVTRPLCFHYSNTHNGHADEQLFIV